MRTRSIFIKALIFLILTFGIHNLEAQNLALGKSYSQSPLPNYPYTAPASDTKSLTDGKYTHTFFWTNPTTVGWQFTKNVTIDIDLGTPQPIQTVTFNTVRSLPSGLFYPRNIFVFLSKDDKNFLYIGDAAIDAGNLPGPYGIKKFALDNIHQTGRFVKLVVLPEGPLVLCDEIEVDKGDFTRQSTYARLITNEHFNETLDSIERQDYKRKAVQRELNGVYRDLLNRDDLSKIRDELSNQYITPTELEDSKFKLRQMHAEVLQKRYSTSFVVEKYNPWDNLTLLHDPISAHQSLDYQFLIPSDGAQYGAFVITNMRQLNQLFNFKISTSNYGVDSIELYNAQYVPAVGYTLVPDPLVPVNKSVSIPLGESQLFLFKIAGLSKGYAQSELTISSGGSKVDLIINSNIVDLFSQNGNRELNAVNWGYLSWDMIKGREEEAVADMNSHHINTVVLIPPEIPRPGDTNFRKLISYLGHFSNGEKILLCTDYNYPYYQYIDHTVLFMSDKWKVAFKQWYGALQNALNVNGFGERNVYLYPYDEVRGKEISDFRKFATWAKQTIPTLKIYATLNSKEAIDSLISLIDVAQILDNDGLKLYHELPVHHCEIWIYKAIGAARSLSPYKYYRLMSWTAYVNNIKGIGFWNYADVGENRLLNFLPNVKLDSRFDYAVIYAGVNKNIVSSRRWEAFRLGIEDYRLLYLYGEKFGKERANTLANKVLSEPDKVNMADSVVSVILKAL